MPAARPRERLADAVVVGVEEMLVGRMKWPVAFQVRREQKRLEKPAGVGQMPFRRAGILHGLDAEVFGLERAGERFTLRPHACITCSQRLLRRARPTAVRSFYWSAVFRNWQLKIDRPRKWYQLAADIL